MSRTRYWSVAVILAVAVLGAIPVGEACSAKGPQDPYTGLITYPNNEGTNGNKTQIPDLPDTPFAGGKFFKAWKGDGMKVIIVPVGSTLVFDGVIQSAAPISPPRPAFWEEGEQQQLYGRLVRDMAPPKWTIFGNGRGDYAPGQAPPTDPGFSLKPFEMGPDCMIVEDTPAVKALWKLSYDQKSAINMLGIAYNDPVYKAAIDKALPPGADFANILQNAGGREPQFDLDAKKLNNFEISPTGPEGVEGLRKGLREALPHTPGCQTTEEVVERRFKNADGTASYTKKLPATAGLILKAGYIAMQEWYASGKYNTKFLITPPSGSTVEFGGEQLVKKFEAPTAPDYWTIDLNSGLESCKDCVWCWIEAKGTLKPADSKIDPSSSNEKFYDVDPTSIAIGGVMVRGYYQSGNSTAGRNTLVYVVVADTEPPAAFEWLDAFAIKGETGKPLAATNQANALRLRVYDNNPLLGADKFKNIHEAEGVKGLADFEFVEAGKRQGGSNVVEVYKRYLEPVKDGYGEANFRPRLAYNVCVAACLGFKLTGSAAALEKYVGPVPNLHDRVALVSQRFVWKTASEARVIGRQVYNSKGETVTGLAALQNQFEWSGYGSFDLEVPLSSLDEPMGTRSAAGSRRYDLTFAEAGLAAPSGSPAPGVPVQNGKLQFYPWSDKALKIFPIVQDGVGNQTPREATVNAILATRFSGLDVKSPDDAVASWTDPADLDGAVAATPVKGGRLGLDANLPGKTGAGPFDWGRFAFVASLKDKGRPQIALEIRNAKNEKAVLYGNFAAMGDLPGYYAALAKAGSNDWCSTTDSNKGIAAFTSDSPNDADELYVFEAGLAQDLYLDMQSAIEAGRFRPWLFNLPENTDVGLPIWGANYWNGRPAYNHDRLAYQQGNRDRLLFRYWAWDNLNPYDWQHSSFPQGVKIQSGDREFKAVKADKITARVTLIDKPVYPGDGKVPATKVWWPDYIFQNPSHRSAGTYEECSIALEAEDEAGNKPRLLKVFFRIIPPGVETIRTLEDNRERQK
jgi:hypothetical protein